MPCEPAPATSPTDSRTQADDQHDRGDRRPPAMSADERRSPSPSERREPADDEQRRRGAALDGERGGARAGGRGVAMTPAGVRRRERRSARGRRSAPGGRRGPRRRGRSEVNARGAGPARRPSRPLALGRDRGHGSTERSWRRARSPGAATRPVASRRRGRRLDGRGRDLASLEVLAAPGAQRPVHPDEPAAVRADAVQARPAGRADDPLVVDPPVAARAVVDRLDLGEERLLGQVPLPDLADLLVRPDDLVDPDGEDEEDRGEQDDPGRREVRQDRRCPTAAACRGTPSRPWPARGRRGRCRSGGGRTGRSGCRRRRRSCRRSG